MKAWPTNYECEGQTSIFDFLKDDGPEILLNPGEHVWKVILGDIFEFEVEDWTYTCGENDRGYGLIYIDPEKNNNPDFHTYSRAWNKTIGFNVFKTLEEATQKAAENMEQVEHILATDMYPKKIVAYETNYRGYKKVNWYAELDDDLVYFNYGSIYDHIGIQSEIKDFEASLRKNEGEVGYHEPVAISDYKPRLLNMYKCQDGKWKYGAARYFAGGII